MPMKDEFPGSAQALVGGYHRWVTITPSANVLDERPRAIHNSGSAGTITMTDETSPGSSVAIYFAQGATLQIRPIKITAAGAGVVVVALF